MTRKKFILFFFPLIILVIVTFGGRSEASHLQSLAQMVVGLMAWAVLWFRMIFLRRRAELSLLPALPLLLVPLNRLLFAAPDAAGGLFPFYDYLMVFAWVGSAIVLCLAVAPDAAQKGQRRRMDPLSIVMTVFICYLCLSYIASHMERIIQ